jgi:hypothetical protein
MSCKHDLDNCPECGPFAREGGAMTFAENRLVERLSRAPGVPAAAAEIDVDDDLPHTEAAANGLRHTEWRRAGDRQRGGRGVEPW